MNVSFNLRMTVFASLMAAVIAAGAFVSIPVGPVPVVLQNLFVLLAGLLLGSRWAAASVGVFLLAGACGLPVFAGGAAGIGKFAGPTGGYLIGYFLAAVVVGAISERGEGNIIVDIFALILGVLAIYGPGLVWLKIVTHMTWQKTLAAGCLPFLIGDGLKIAAAALLAQSLRPVIQDWTESSGENGSEPSPADR